ncbi:MAG: aspartyl/glutamyl-tRNA amidotransferase subunit C [Spirochaetaceae bacterium]|jgi:aspartyl-tRNA(Asn)/glutamyl-tRNA(Gln) amidotransferase subunit C|nr:aspartyl/glutamyl-tRNA amidotransferase subunit C [Spirochaetaceae bacterium]
MENEKVALEDLRITAELARLPLDEAELQAALPAFQDMLAYFTAMQRADSDAAAFCGALQDDVNVCCFTAGTSHFRPDVQSVEKPAAPQAMLELAGERDGNFIVMPNVL